MRRLSLNPPTRVGLRLRIFPRAKLQGDAPVVRRIDALVQADGRAQLRLQAAVLVNVVVSQRLFNHQQVELIERTQTLGIGQGVGAVGIEHQRDIGKPLTNGARQFDVPARARS